MSFRKYGGMNYAATHNIVKSNVNTTDSFYVTNNVGQKNSYINFDSDISGNVLIFGDFDLSGNLHVSGDIDCSGNLTVVEDIDCSGNLHVSGDIDCSGNLTVDGDIDCSGNLNVFEDFTIDGSLNVTGNSYFIGAMDASAIYLTANKIATDYADDEVVPKSYVDTVSQGLNVKTPCDCVATDKVIITDSLGNTITNFNVTTTYTTGLIIDGYDLSANFSSVSPSRVLVNDQGNPDTNPDASNGIYNAVGSPVSISFVRSPDMQTGSDALGAYTFIQNGTEFGRSSWVQNQKIDNTGTPVIVGSTSLFFSEYQSFKYRLGRGLDLLYNLVDFYTYLNIDTSLNAINYLDNSYTGTTNPGSNTNTINIGAYTPTINIGSSNVANLINITGTVDVTGSLTVSGSSYLTGDVRAASRLYIGIDNPDGGSGDTAYLEYVGSGTLTDKTVLRIVTQDLGDDHINLNPSGNVGIKTDTPAYTLDVAGSLNVTNATTVAAITSSALQPGPTDATTTVPTTAWVQSAISSSSTVPGAIPIGGIIMWSGSTIPTNWGICDGNNSTPDLRDRFIVGAGYTYSAGQTGGESTVQLTTAEMPAHNHTININDPQHNHGITDPQHAHTIQDPGHFHNIKPFNTDGADQGTSERVDYTDQYTEVSSTNKTGISILQASTGISINQAQTGISATSAQEGGGGAHENRPPYYALYYIMRMS